MWPEDFELWLQPARETAEDRLLVQLHLYPILHGASDSLTRRSLTRAEAAARQRWAWWIYFPTYFADRLQFARWFFSVAYRACLRRVLRLEEVGACVAALPANEQQLLIWLYVDLFTFQEVAGIQPTTAATVRQESRQAYHHLRSRIAARLGEANDAFPLFPCAAGWGF